MNYDEKIAELNTELAAWKQKQLESTYGTDPYIKAVAEANFIRGTIVAYENFMELPQETLITTTIPSMVWFQSGGTQPNHKYTVNLRVPMDHANFLKLENKQMVNIMIQKEMVMRAGDPFYRKLSGHGKNRDQSQRYMIAVPRENGEALPKNTVIKWVPEWEEK